MNAKKLLALLLALVLCLGVLAGCNSDPKETTQSTTKATEGTTAGTTEGATTPAEPLKNADIYPLDTDTELEVIIINGTSTPYEGRENVVTWERATGVHINWKEIADVAAYTTSISGGDWADVAIASGFDKSQIYEFGQAGKLVNLVEYKDIMPNLWRAFEEIPGAYETVVNEDGSIYSLPTLSNTTTVGSPIYYRTDMAKAAGLEKMPETIEEFMTWLKGWQDYYGKDGAEFYCILPYSSNDVNYAGTMANFFFPSFGELVKTGLHEHNGKVVLGAATEQYKHYLEFMNELYNMDGFYKDCFVADANFTKGLISESKTGVATTMTHLTLDAFPSGEYDIYGLKPLTSEYWSTPHNAKKNVASWSNKWISTECEDIETACRWLDAFLAPLDNPLNEEGTLWSLTPWRGELGVNFEWVGENGYRNYVPEGYATHLAWITANYIDAGLIGDVPYIDDANSALSRKSYIMGECMDPFAQEWGNLTYITLSADDQADYQDAWADIDTYLKDMHAAFITGEKDLEAEWDNYLATLDKMGLQEIYEIYQGYIG